MNQEHFLSYKAVYVGNLVTSSGIPLHGKVATIFNKYLSGYIDNNNNHTTRYRLHARFEDPELGQYHSYVHWFWENEFQQVQQDVDR